MAKRPTNLVQGATAVLPEEHVKVPTVAKPEDNQRELRLIAIPDTTKTFLVRLGDILPLDKAFKDGKIAMRPLDPKNLASLMLADDRDVPPIIVQNSNGMVVKTDSGKETYPHWIVVAGYHRIARIAAKVELAYREKNNLLAKDKEGFIYDLTVENLPLLSDKQEQELRILVENAKIRARGINANSSNDLIMQAIEDNSSHGLPTSGTVRCRYAWWLIELNNKLGTPITMREAGRRAKVSHVAMIHYRDLQKKKSEQESGVATPKTEEEVKRQLLSDTDKAARLVAKSLRVLWLGVKDDTEDDVIEYLAQYFTAEDKDMLAVLPSCLSGILEMEAEEEEEEEEEEQIEYVEE